VVREKKLAMKKNEAERSGQQCGLQVPECNAEDVIVLIKRSIDRKNKFDLVPLKRNKSGKLFK